ncbi:Small, acid-soluble spore protein, alpha/beta type [Thermoactinomyces sp. DSM 45892]|nr:alpha/beta-type small acid-soluble spore protein [Thermoactinomyces sp. DSM 45892]SDX92846.1 Small, acid-soluble spore protein, alpha/beta type [Thermoactinomyces sp. DSM 45892]
MKHTHNNQVQNSLDQMKNEIASEFGVQLGADTASRENGYVGGEITRRLVQLGATSIRA